MASIVKRNNQDAEAMVEMIEQSEGIHYLKILGRE